MDHVELHNELSEAFKALKNGTLKPQLAKEIFNGAGKILNNCRNELTAIQLGIDVDIPLLGVKKIDVDNIRELNAVKYGLQIDSGKKKRKRAA